MVDIYKGNYPDFEVNFALIPTGPGWHDEFGGGW